MKFRNLFESFVIFFGNEKEKREKNSSFERKFYIFLFSATLDKWLIHVSNWPVTVAICRNYDKLIPERDSTRIRICVGN